MVVNFKARGISRGTRKLIRTPTLKKKKNFIQALYFSFASCYHINIKNICFKAIFQLFNYIYI
jgi:hypothetical protein